MKTLFDSTELAGMKLKNRLFRFAAWVALCNPDGIEYFALSRPLIRESDLPARWQRDDRRKAHHVLQLLELLKNLDSYMDGDYNETREKIEKYTLANSIQKTDIDRYIRYYPDSTFRFYYEMRLDDVLAR